MLCFLFQNCICDMVLSLAGLSEYMSVLYKTKVQIISWQKGVS